MGSKQGLPLVLTIAVVNTSSGCAPVAGALVDIWQCDAGGSYWQYGSERTLTYLRGLQTIAATSGCPRCSSLMNAASCMQSG